MFKLTTCLKMIQICLPTSGTSCCCWQRHRLIISFIHPEHSQNKYHTAGCVTRFVSAGWTNTASGLHHHLCALLLVALGNGAERSGPPQTQGVVLPGLLRWHHGFTCLALGRRVALAVAGPGELTLPAGCRQQWHEGVNTVEEEEMESGRKWKCKNN